MSKAKYHVPQPGETIKFATVSGIWKAEIVKSWDVKHGVLTTFEGDRYRIENRLTIKLVAPAPVADAPEPHPRTEEHLFREPPHSLTGPEETASCRLIRFIPSNTVTLPTSFASEVARAQAIADAEAEETKRHEAVNAKSNELADKIAALVSERRDVMAEDEGAQQDFENRLEYLQALRVRKSK